MPTASPVQNTSKPKSTGTTKPAPIEPFGQTGVLHYAIPMLSLVSLVLACFCAVMWVRSFDTDDAIARRVDRSILQIDSLSGGVIVRRYELFGRVFPGDRDTGWHYGTAPLPDRFTDPWPASFFRTIGVEFGARPMGTTDSNTGGWWCGVKWRTLVVLGLILPFWRAIKQQFRRWNKDEAEVPRGFARWLP